MNGADTQKERWQWQGIPPGPQVAEAGQIWTFRMPLTGPGKPPTCQWQDLPWPPTCQKQGSDGLTLEVQIPADLVGTFRLRYMIAGHNHLNGILRLKVLPVGAESPTQKVPDEPATQKGSPAPEQPEPPQAPSAAATPSSQQPPADSVPPLIEPSEALPDSLLIRVLSGSTEITELRTELKPHRSVLVGKRSLSKRIFPDIDLYGHFPDPAQEQRCSRQQVRIYRSEGRVLVRNVGTAALGLPEGGTLITDQEYCWPLGKELRLPGEITLILEEA